MKTTLVFSVLLIVIFSCNQKDKKNDVRVAPITPEENDLINSGLKGNVKSYTFDSYAILWDSNNVQDDSLISGYLWQFNKAGMRSYDSAYQVGMDEMQPPTVDVTKYTYNEKGALSELIFISSICNYSSSGWQSVYEYNAKGQLVAEINSSYYGQGDFSEDREDYKYDDSTAYAYDSNGDLTKETTFNQQGKEGTKTYMADVIISSSGTVRLNYTGDVMKKTTLSEEGIKTYETTNNSNGDLTKETTLDKEGTKTSETDFDKNGNWVRSIVFKFGKPKEITKATIVYY